MNRYRGILMVALVLGAGSASAGTYPEVVDSWTEYAAVADAEADGWVRTCGLAQAITVANDCCMGDWSVGCRAIRAYWCDEFGLEKQIPLTRVRQVNFSHVAPWSWLDADGWQEYGYEETLT